MKYLLLLSLLLTCCGDPTYGKYEVKASRKSSAKSGYYIYKLKNVEDLSNIEIYSNLVYLPGDTLRLQ